MGSDNENEEAAEVVQVQEATTEVVERTSRKSKSSVKGESAKSVNHNNNLSKHQNANSAPPAPAAGKANAIAKSVRPPTSRSAKASPVPVPSAPSSERVKVIVRCRPLSKKEETQGHSSVVTVNLEKKEVEVHRPNPSSINLVNTKSNKIFTFDSIYDETISQSQLYEDAFRPIVDSVLQGFNGTIFAYGQTGTGKTYTMEGIRDQEEHHGVIPNAFKQIFGQIQNSPNIKYLVRASYLEIYQEEIRDLLYKNKIRNCELKESTTAGVYVKDLSSYLCGNFNEINELMSRGNKNRSVGATNMNEHSSRSHAIFIITIEASEVWSDGKTHFRVGKLNLVDLAGSERQGKSGAEGERLKEAVKINLSLSALGNVIQALVDGRYNHIPYRDSKLTRLLQDSLGGNSKTIMVATIGPASFNYDETMTTLRYASRAKRIKNKPKVNEDPKDAMLREYQDEIAKLKAQLAMRRTEAGFDNLSLNSRPSTSTGKKRRSGTGKSKQQEFQQVEVEDETQPRFPSEIESLLETYGIDPQGLDPKQIVKLLEERRVELVRNNQIVKEEKDRLLSQLDKAKTKIQYSDAECTKLVEKIQWFESKVLNGGKNLLDYTNEQQKLIQLKQKELKEQKMRQDDIRRKIEEHELSATEINEVIAKMESEIEVKETKNAKLCNRIEKIKEQIVKTQEVYGHQRTEMEMCQSELQKEIKLKRMIIDNFIPPSSRETIEQLLDFDQTTQSYSTKPFSSITLPRPAVDRMILQPLLKRSDDLELKDVPNVYYSDENILQLQPIQPKPDAKIYVPPALDPQISLLLKRAFADAEKDLVIDCNRTKRKFTGTRVGEPIRTGSHSFMQPILPPQPLVFNGVDVQDFIIVSPQTIIRPNTTISTKSSFKSARSFEEAHRIGTAGKRLQLRPGSAKGKIHTKF